MEETENRETRTSDRVLGDEWLDWEESAPAPSTREGKRTFLFVSLIVVAGFTLLVVLLWYLILPRFVLYGRLWAILITIACAAIVGFALLWYLSLIITVVSRTSYFNLCLRSGSGLLFALLSPSMKLAQRFGISRDRLGHSFIRVSNMLVRNAGGDGDVLALLPRCLTRELKEQTKRICASYPGVVTYTAPGGSVARRIIRETNPRAIVAVACERDLITGIQDIAPRIPVIGIPNSRPVGPCRDTRLDLAEFRSALDFFCKRA